MFESFIAVAENRRSYTFGLSAGVNAGADIGEILGIAMQRHDLSRQDIAREHVLHQRYGDYGGQLVGD